MNSTTFNECLLCIYVRHQVRCWEYKTDISALQRVYSLAANIEEVDK